MFGHSDTRGDGRLIRDGNRRKARRGLLAASFLAGTLASGCTQVLHHGYMIPDGALSQIALGASQDQVLFVLGTPSTVATISGEVFYYISQRGEQTAFLPEREVDRRVIGVYFDKNRRVERLADYGLQDGKLFDFVSRTTPTSGKEVTSLTYMFKIFGAQ